MARLEKLLNRLESKFPARELMIVILCLIGSLGRTAHAQPKLSFFSNPQKIWLPSTVGTLPILFTNSGDQDLIITSVELAKPISQLSFYFKPIPIVVHPGDTTHVGLSYSSSYPYEFNVDVKFTSNDLSAPIKTVHLRINDSIPPNPVRSVTATPGKAGAITLTWERPSLSRDGDSIGLYAIYGRRELDTKSQLLLRTSATSATLNPPGDGLFVFAILAYDDMGNRSQVVDSFWTDRTPPKSVIANVDLQTSALPLELAIGQPTLHIWSADAHLSELHVSYSDTSATSPLFEIDRKLGAFGEKEKSFNVHWDTRAFHGDKDITIYARDIVGNESTVRYRFRLNQLIGWPRTALNGARAQSSPLISLDATGRLLLTGSDVANGAYRPDGSHYFGRWPLNFVQGDRPAVILSTADADPSPGFETFTTSATNNVVMFSYLGAPLREYQASKPATVVRLIREPSLGELVATGPSPMILQRNGMPVSLGATNIWTLAGEKLDIPPMLSQEAETDRFVIGRLLQNDEQGVVRVAQLNPLQTSITLYDLTGNAINGWPKIIAESSVLLYPSLGDIDGDGKLDIVLPSSKDSIFAWSADGEPLLGFPLGAQTHALGFNQLLIADINGDKAGDVIFPTPEAIVAIDGKTGAEIHSEFFPIYRSNSGATMLTIADLNSDRVLEIIESPDTLSTAPSWTKVFATNIVDAPGVVQWGTFQHDMNRSGTFETSEPLLHSGVRDSPQLPATSILIADELKIRIPDRSSTHSYQILDVLGRVVMQGPIAPSSEEVSIDCKNLAKGTYLLRIHNFESMIFQR